MIESSAQTNARTDVPNEIGTSGDGNGEASVGKSVDNLDLQAERIRAGVEQSDVALELSDSLGREIHRSQLSRWERGHVHAPKYISRDDYRTAIRRVVEKRGTAA